MARRRGGDVPLLEGSLQVAVNLEVHLASLLPLDPLDVDLEQLRVWKEPFPSSILTISIFKC